MLVPIHLTTHRSIAHPALQFLRKLVYPLCFELECKGVGIESRELFWRFGMDPTTVKFLFRRGNIHSEAFDLRNGPCSLDSWTINDFRHEKGRKSDAVANRAGEHQ